MLTYVKSEKGARTHPLLPLRDCTHCFPRVSSDRPLIVEAQARLRSRSCIIDGEAVARDETGIAQFNRICYRSYDSTCSCTHMECDDGEIVFRHACKLGLEGIVSKRKASPYRSGRSQGWLKSKNPACEAVRREAEEDWGR